MSAPSFQTILCPIDFSSTSRKALKYALHLAQEFNGDLYVLHVVEPILGPLFEISYVKNIPLVEEEMKRQAEKEMEKIRQIHHYEKLHPLVLIGDSTETILKQIEALTPDAVIIGTHGHTGLSHFFLGSTAEKIIRSSEVPVLTIRGDEE